MTINVEFGSDNHSGVHPLILEALASANENFSVAYGYDKYTKEVIDKFKVIFGNDIDVFFVYNGTAANILGLNSVVKPYNSIICSDIAHLNVHECCGPEKFIGCKLTTIKTDDGKLTVDMVKPHVVGLGDEHMAQPKVISITQPTERGTVYSISDIKGLAEFAHKNNMFLHMDGARICNAAVKLKKSFKDITFDAGVDILSFGGTKNGMMFGEAVVFSDRKTAKDFKFIRKQGMQLASKMRFIAVQFDVFLNKNFWYENAKHANNMAALLSEELNKIPDIRITQKVETNAVFVNIPEIYHEELRKKYFFHVLDEKTSEVRFMCSFNTNKQEVLNLSNTIKEIVHTFN
jgi:threonine aldolase